jgi:type I restriction enzyme, S subunit
MASEWPLMKLKAADVILIDCDHRTPPAAKSGYPYVAIPQLQGGRINFDGVRLITQEHFVEWTRKAKPIAYDVVLSRRCNPGETAFVSPELEFAVGQNLVLLRSDGTKIYQPFLRWLVQGPEWWEQVDKFINVGAVFDSLKCADIPNFELHIPPLPEQHAIAGILGALDDKIELNRRMNRTLESMARTVFRELVKDVEEQGSILEFANLLSGGTPSTGEVSYWNGDIEWVSAKDVSNANGIFLLDTEKKITQAGVDNSSTKVLPAKTVIVTARGTVGAHCMLGKPMAMNQTNYGLKAKDGIGDYFTYFTLSEMVEQLKQQSYGTIFDTITTKTFHNALCACPSQDVIQKFEDMISPFIDTVLNNQKESRTLASLRDTLLPKLMRGEVRVKDLENAT